MKRISVRLYAGLRRAREHTAGAGQLSTGAATVGSLLEELGISEADAAMIFVNGQRAATDSAIQDGDEVRVFPLVGGG